MRVDTSLAEIIFAKFRLEEIVYFCIPVMPLPALKIWNSRMCASFVEDKMFSRIRDAVTAAKWSMRLWPMAPPSANVSTLCLPKPRCEIPPHSAHHSAIP